MTTSELPADSYRALVAAAPDGVVVVARDGTILLANPALERLTGWTAGELIGQPLEILVPSAHRALHAADRETYGRRPHLRPMGSGLHLSACRKDGTEVPVEIMLSPMRLGREAATVAFVRDATDRRRYDLNVETALVRAEKLRALGQMAAGIAHDFKNLLNPLALHVEVMERALRRAGVERPDSIGVIRDIIQRGVETIDRLRTFSRLEPESIADYIDPARLASDAVELARPRLADHPAVQLEQAIAPTGLVRGHATDVVAALVNLIVNAIEACGDRGTITVVTGMDDTSAWIEIVDDGPGMSPEVQARMFEPFFSTKGAQGTGLGLANVFATLQRHGGEIAVESAPGRGSKFTVHLPR
jgi:hypothetical protein